MDKAKLIEYLQHKDDCKVMNSEIIRIDDLIEKCDTQEEFDAAYEKRKSEIPCTCGLDLILTSLTAPVDGKEECEECAARQNKIEELNNELEMTVDELINYYRDKWKECRSKLRDSHRY